MEAFLSMPFNVSLSAIVPPPTLSLEYSTSYADTFQSDLNKPQCAVKYLFPALKVRPA